MKQEQRQQAQDLYLQSDLTQQQIANILNVDRRSLGRWMKEGRWQSLKMAARNMPMQLSQNIYNHIEAVEKKIHMRAPEDQCPTMEEIEMLRKLYNILGKVPECYSAGSYLQAYAHLIQELSRKRALQDEEYEKVRRTAQSIVAAYCEDIQWQTDGEWDRLKENLKKIEADQEPADAQEALSEQQINVPSATNTGDNGTFCKNDIDPAKPAPVASNEQPDNAKDPSKCPIPVFSGNETFEEPGSYESFPIIRHFASMPPEQRPSPFRDGDILWVNEIDDVDNKLNNLGQPWGERKIGDNIRRYSDLL